MNLRDMKRKINQLSTGLTPWENVKDSFTFYEKDHKKAKKMQALWETVLLWSGYDGYYTVKEIAEILHIRIETVYSRLKRFKKLYLEAYEKIQEDRNSIKKTICRQDNFLLKPEEYQTSMDNFIKEKF